MRKALYSFFKLALLTCAISIYVSASNAADCDFSPEANQPPNVPKALLASQQFVRIGETQARYVGTLRSGKVLLSTHSACIHYGARVLLVVPDAEAKNLRADIRDLIAWYVEPQSARVLFEKIARDNIRPGWSKDLTDASLNFSSFSARVVRGDIEGYVIVQLDYFSI